MGTDQANVLGQKVTYSFLTKSPCPRRSYVRELRCERVVRSTRLGFMSRVKLVLVSSLAVLVVSLSWLIYSSGTTAVGAAGPTASPSQAPTSSPEYRPGPSSVSGRVVRLIPGGVVVDSAGRQIEVSFSGIVDVWRETSMPASAIEVGDDVFVNGTDGSPFVARYISANIGRIDGVICEIDDVGMLVEVQLRWGGTKMQRVDFSPYIEYGYNGGPKLTRADLVVGRTIGAVIYRAGGSIRATRIW